MEHELLQLKNEFDQKLAKYKIPTENRANLYFQLGSLVADHPENEELIDLLITAVADCNLFISYYDHYEPDEYPELLDTVRSRIKKLRKAIEKERQYKNFWENILERKTVPQLKELDPDMNKKIEAEALKLSKIFCEYFEIDLKKSGELLNNLIYFVQLSYSYPDYHKIAPYYFWKIMVKHKSRLVKNDHLQFKPDSLWKNQEYNIEQDNQKNFKEYERYSNLFLELTDYYKKFEDVKLNYSRYAFCNTCNLLKWMDLYRIKGRKQFKTPLRKRLSKYSVSCQEITPPEDFDPELIYNISSMEEYTYYDLFGDQLSDIHHMISHYIYEDVDCIIDFMKYLYVDSDKIRRIIEDTYDKAELSKVFPRSIPLTYRYYFIYCAYLSILDDVLESRILASFKAIV